MLRVVVSVCISAAAVVGVWIGLWWCSRSGLDDLGGGRGTSGTPQRFILLDFFAEWD